MHNPVAYLLLTLSAWKGEAPPRDDASGVVGPNPKRSSQMSTGVLSLCLSLVLATTASAQGLMDDMHRDASGVQKKFIDLAKAIPENAYSWHPNGARSVGEVLLHIAGENYLIPSFMGKAIPAG